MTAADLRASLALLGMSQLGAARLFGVNGKTVRNWVAGRNAVPPAVAIALRLMLKHGEKLEDVKQ